MTARLPSPHWPRALQRVLPCPSCASGPAPPPPGPGSKASSCRVQGGGSRGRSSPLRRGSRGAEPLRVWRRNGPGGGHGQGGGAAPRPESGSARRTRGARGTWSGPDPCQGLRLHRSRRTLVCPGARLSVLTGSSGGEGVTAPWRSSCPSPGWKSLGFNEKKATRAGSRPWGGHAGGGCAPLGNSHSPWLRFQPQVCVLQIFFGGGRGAPQSPTGRRAAAQRPDHAAAPRLSAARCNSAVFFSKL